MEAGAHHRQTKEAARLPRLAVVADSPQRKAPSANPGPPPALQQKGLSSQERNRDTVRASKGTAPRHAPTRLESQGGDAEDLQKR